MREGCERDEELGRRRARESVGCRARELERELEFANDRPITKHGGALHATVRGRGRREGLACAGARHRVQGRRWGPRERPAGGVLVAGASGAAMVTLKGAMATSQITIATHANEKKAKAVSVLCVIITKQPPRADGG